MNTQELYEEISVYKEVIRKDRSNDVKTKYKTIALLNEVLKELDRGLSKPPIVISEDGKTFKCPRCKVTFESEEGTYDDYTVCYICGQKFRDLREGELD